MAIATLLSAGYCSAAEAKSSQATVTVRLADDGMDAVIDLDHPVSSLIFAHRDVVRNQDFDILTPGLTLKQDTIESTRPFTRVTLRVKPMSEERDAKYPAHFRLGAGGVLYAPALALEEASWRTTFLFKTKPGQVRLPDRDKAEDGFVFIGPARLAVQKPHVIVVGDPKTPSWILERSQNALESAVQHYTGKLGIPLRNKPLLFVKHDGLSSPTFVADVSPGAITVLRYHGQSWETPNDQAATSMQIFVYHEAFHFWNGGLASNGPGTPAWLHEGGAEYAAIVSAHEAAILSESEFLGRLGEALELCRRALIRQGDKSLSELGFLPADTRYPCGVVIQWAADLHLRHASAGKQAAMDAWRTMIGAAAKREKHEYSLADFYAAIGVSGDDVVQPINLLVRQSGPDRWTALAPALNALGAEVALAETERGRRERLVFHLIRQNCRNLPAGSNVGFNLEADTILFANPPQCGALENARITSVEGGSIVAVTPATFEAVRDKCARKEPVELKTKDGVAILAACDAPLPNAPKSFVVRRWIPDGAAAAAATI